MKISLRPHHLLCIQGYKGFNYSKSQVSSWSSILKQLYPGADILITSGYDDLCKKCPAILSKNQSKCLESLVDKLDKNIENVLNIKKGQIYKYSEILNRLQQRITTELHEQFCSDCAWWKKGLCRDSFKK